MSCWYPQFYVSEVELYYLLLDVLQGNRISDPLDVMYTVGGMLLDLASSFNLPLFELSLILTPGLE